MTLTPASDPARISDIRMARVHLRMGQLTLARAELEDLYRRDALDNVGLAVLAEARWRTGEGPGAAEAALAHLQAGGSDDVAHARTSATNALRRSFASAAELFRWVRSSSAAANVSGVLASRRYSSSR